MDKVEAERFRICTRLKNLDSSFVAPRGMRPPKCVDKLYIPKEKEGTLNFIGLILGPRGNTQKRLEKDYDCKVAIRGKGSVKDGRARGPPQPEDNEALHVVISAEGLDGMKRIEGCKRRILDIITPRQDDENDHKQAQLRELAQLNGTLREQDRDFRPNKQPTNGDVVCAICADPSHPTPDCPKHAKGDVQANLDPDYQSFMAELGGKSADPERPKPEAHPAAAHPTDPSSAAAPGNGRATPPWLLTGSFATRPPAPPPHGTVLPPAAPPFAPPHQQAPSGFPPYGMAPRDGHGARPFAHHAMHAQGRGGVLPYGNMASHPPAPYPPAPYMNPMSQPPQPPHYAYAQYGDMGGAHPPPPPPPPDMMDPPPPPPPPDMMDPPPPPPPEELHPLHGHHQTHAPPPPPPPPPPSSGM